MVSMRLAVDDSGSFDVYENATYIGHIWQRADKIWLFERAICDIADNALVDVQSIIDTLNL